MPVGMDDANQQADGYRESRLVIEFDRAPIIPLSPYGMLDDLIREAEVVVNRTVRERLEWSWRFRELLQGCE